MQKCPFCDYQNDNLDSIRIHTSKKHKKSAMEVRLLMFHDNVRPLCKCGCGTETRFQNIHTGFNDFIRGHHSRVNNNWGHNKEALDKSHATTKARYESGEIVVWNKGLTTFTDERVANYGKKGSETIQCNELEKQRRSERMSENRCNGTIQSPVGSQHGNWKGGVSTVNGLARSYVYSVWTFPKMCEQRFTCQHCGIKSSDGCVLNVHHDKERFAEILQKARVALGDVDSFEKIQEYARWVADYHAKNNVSGLVLCQSCHDLEHTRC